MVPAVALLLVLFTYFACADGAPPRIAEVGGQSASRHVPLHPEANRVDIQSLLARPPASDLEKVYAEFSSVLLVFFGKAIAPPDGLERPSLYEAGYADYLVPLSPASQCHGTIQGATNLRYLSGPYFYNENNGAFGVRCNLLSTSMPDTVLSVQISPAAGSIALIRYHSMVPTPADESTPTQVFLGSMAGIEAFHRFHAGVTAGLRLYARGELDVTSGGMVGGVSHYESAYLRFDVADMMNRRLEIPVSIILSVQTFDRGDHRSTIYDFEESTPRGAEMVRMGAEGQLLFSFQL